MYNSELLAFSYVTFFEELNATITVLKQWNTYSVSMDTNNI